MNLNEYLKGEINTPVIVDVDYLAKLHQKAERCFDAISQWEWARDKRRRYLRDIEKYEGVLDAAHVEVLDDEFLEAEINLMGVYESYANEDYVTY